jgi:regulator of sigma E protease
MEWWQIVIGVVVGLLLLTILVILHELGHAFAARKSGVEVEEFGIGFPPRARILGKYKGTLITLNWLLPIGGFCKMKGESDAARSKGSYGAASYGRKSAILFAGVFVNFATAVLIFTVLSLFGLPKITSDQFAIPADNHGQAGIVAVSSVTSDSPAERAGLQVGDEIVSVNGQSIEISAQVPEITQASAGSDVSIEIRRDGDVRQVTATLNAENTGQGYLGIGSTQAQAATIRATWSAPIVGVVNTVQFAGLTLNGLGGLVVNFASGIAGSFAPDATTREQAGANLSTAGDSVAGPVGILGVIFPNAMMAGATQLAFITGIISLTLAIMNILPIPGLDGGRWLLTTIFRIIRRPLTENLEGTINGIGMILLFGLIIVITVADVLKLW